MTAGPADRLEQKNGPTRWWYTKPGLTTANSEVRMADGTIIAVWICAQCSAEFTGRKRKFCSATCCRTAHDRNKYPRTWDEYAADVAAKALRRTCPRCGEIFRPTRGDIHPNGPQIYCSRKCADGAKSEKARKQAFIAREERVYAKWAKAAARRIANEAEQARLQHCRHCGCYLQERKKRQTLCATCIEVGKRKTRSVAKMKRRVAAVERFDPIEVLERDGWRCHMCGTKTPKRLRGTYEPNAPELDHIIPIAAGGEHSRRNTACACRKCNNDKGARPMGQLRLVA